MPRRISGSTPSRWTAIASRSCDTNLPNLDSAVLYEPDKLEERSVSLTSTGMKTARWSSTRICCINMAKRGMIVLNVEWLGMGQLRSAGYRHGVMNQLDLCGSSGLAPFFLSMSRGLDILLANEHADPKRVVVSGLSGGGWQTIVISSLDTRVTLSNPVAGYSSFLTRIDHFKDLGDSEQTPTDLAMYADYTHLTAMLAPRPTLLTYNSKDECCFESGYVLEPLRGAGGAILRCSIAKRPCGRTSTTCPARTTSARTMPGLYRMLGEFFYPGDARYSSEEIPCDKEVRRRSNWTSHFTPNPST